MKILHVITSLDPSTGGPARIALRLAAGAASLGHQVTLLRYASPPETQKAIDQDLAVVIDSDRITQIVLPQPSRLERLTARKAKRTLRPLIHTFNVIHTHDVWSPLCRSSMFMAARQKVPFVLLPNGMFDFWSMQQKALKKRLFLALGYRAVLNRALFIHTGNVDEQSGVSHVGVTAPMEIIPNGVYPKEFDPLPPKGQFYAAYPALLGRPFILFLSRLHHKKGLDYLAAAFIKIATAFPQVQLVVAGPDEGAAEPFRKQIAGANLVDRLHMVGPMFDADRYTAMIDAACFCLPSRQEGFSIAILEAMACACPVVISDQCHFPQVAAARAGLVVQLENSELVDALILVLSDPNHAASLGATARHLVMNQYTWPVIARQLVGTYQAYLTKLGLSPVNDPPTE